MEDISLENKSHMYTLYVKPGCPFCEKVLRVVTEHNVPMEIKETTTDGVVEELITHGGKRQVPYLVDPTTGAAMYESDEIITYLMTKTSGDASKDESADGSDGE